MGFDRNSVCKQRKKQSYETHSDLEIVVLKGFLHIAELPFKIQRIWREI